MAQLGKLKPLLNRVLLTVGTQTFSLSIEEFNMSNTVTELLESAKILANVNGDNLLSYLIEMALIEARETKSVPVAAE